MSQLYAAELPERVERVALLNTFVSPQYLERALGHIRQGDRPLPTVDDLYATWRHVGETWSEDPAVMVDFICPSQLENESFIRWVGRFQRFAASPKDFLSQLDSAFALDVGDAPERMTAPTLVMHVTGDRVLPVVMGRLLGELIPDATYMEISGEDHYSWMMPNWRDVIDNMVEFYTGSMATRTTTRQFGTVLFTDIVDSTRQSSALGDTRWREVLDGHDRITRRLVDGHGGRVVKSTGDGLLAFFSMPSEGVACGLEVLRELGGMGLAIRAGLHAGELEVHDDGDISGLAVNLAARVEQAAENTQLWASSTIRDMTLGGDVTFSDEGEHELKGIQGNWRLFSASV